MREVQLGVTIGMAFPISGFLDGGKLIPDGGRGMGGGGPFHGMGCGGPCYQFDGGR